MIRRKTIILLLLVALLISIITAWICAGLPSPLTFDPILNAGLRTELWERADARHDSSVEKMRITNAFSGFGRSFIVIRPDIDLPERIHVHEAGWPWRVFRGREYITPALTEVLNDDSEQRTHRFALPLNLDLELLGPKNITTTTGSAVGLGSLYLNPAPARIIPLQPLWPGLLFNTLFIAVILVALPLVRFVAFGAVRVVRGRCAWCGYDLRGADHAACPECGHTHHPPKRYPAVRRAGRRFMRWSYIPALLFAGAVINLAVAVSCAVWAPIDVSRPVDLKGNVYTPAFGAPSGWYITRRRQFGVLRVHAIFRMPLMSQPTVELRKIFPSFSELPDVMETQLADAMAMNRNPYAPDAMLPTIVYEDARGWPMLSLHSHHDYGLKMRTVNLDRSTSIGGIQLKPKLAGLNNIINVNNQRTIPLRPVWPGLIVNTLLYAGLLWLLLRGISRRRRKSVSAA